MSVFLQPIYTQTVGAGGAAAITFNNIPQGFTDLKLVHSARDGRTDAPFSNSILTFNGNTNAIYSVTNLYAVVAANGSSRYLGESWFFYNLYSDGAVATANTFSSSEVYISSYSGGNFKQVLFQNAVENNSVGTNANILLMAAGLFRSNTPITSMTITAVNGIFAQHSSWTLYGVSSAYDTAIPAAPTIGTVTDLAGEVSVAFTANDSGQADSYYAETTSGTLRTYGNNSPIVVQNVPKDSSLQYRAVAVNSLGSGTSSNSSAITTSNDFAAIATINGSGGTFTNIPQYYRNLQIRIVGRANTGLGAAPIMMTLNGNTDTSYVWHQFYGNSTSPATGGLTGQGQIEILYATGAGSSANFYGVAVIDILDYTSTSKFKSVRSLGGYDTNSAGIVGITSGFYPTVAPITSISFTSYAGFDANTRIALYGIG